MTLVAEILSRIRNNPPKFEPKKKLLVRVTSTKVTSENKKALSRALRENPNLLVELGLVEKEEQR